MTQETKQKISSSVKAFHTKNGSYWTGKKFPKESCEKKSQTMKGREFSYESKMKMSVSAQGRWSGDKNPNWKGGKTSGLNLLTKV